MFKELAHESVLLVVVEGELLGLPNRDDFAQNDSDDEHLPVEVVRVEVE